MKITRGTIAAIALSWLASGAGAQPRRCSSMKLTAAGAAARQFLKCEAKDLASTVSPPIFRNCAQRPGTRLDVAFNKADRRGECLSGATADDAFLIVNDLIGRLKTAVNAIAENTFHGPTLCDAKKLRAGGKDAQDKATCAAKAVRGGRPLDGRCITKAETKFATAIERAERGSDCTHTEQAAALEAIVDAFLEDIVAELTSSATTP